MALLCLSAAGAYADGAATADTAETIETVVVSAAKTNERQLDVAIPVSTISSDKLTRNNSMHLEDYASSMPGLSVASSGNGRTSVVIRGISTGNGNNPTVGITLNDVPIGSNMNDTVIPDIDPSILQSVEVLRGPQGSLYGASSMGGLIRYVTKDPSLYGTSGSVGVTASTVAEGGNGYGIHGMLTTPIIEGKLGLQASSFYRFDPGYIDNVRNNQHDINTARTTGGRVALLWQITPDISYQLSGLWETRKSNGTNGTDTTIDRVASNGDFYTQDRIPGTGKGYMNLSIYTGTLKADFGWGDLTAVTAFNRTAFNGPQDVSQTFDRYLDSYFPAYLQSYLGLSDTEFDIDNYQSAIKNYSQSDKFSQEVRLASKDDGDLKWMVGAFFTHESYLSDQVIYVADATTGKAVDFPAMDTAYAPSAYTEYAAFGSATYNFTKQFDLQVGGRIAALHQSYREEDGGLMADDSEKGDSSSNVFTWAITPRYHITKDMMVYARIATGYRPGGPNSASDAPLTYGPDRTTNYEVGFKGILVPDLLTVDASVYNIEWRNIQLQAATSTGYSYIQNGGAARSRGFEITASITPLAGLTITPNFSYSDATLTQSVNNSSVVADKGDRLPYSSKTSGSLAVDQAFPITADIAGNIGGTFNYYGSRFTVFAKTDGGERFKMPAYGTLDLRAGLMKGDWNLSLYVKNVFSQVGFMKGSARDTVNRTGAYDAAVIAPRTVGVSLTRNF